MTKDAVATMGALLPVDVSGRDAVHIAVFSAFSDEKLLGGEDVGIICKEGNDYKVSCDVVENVGIVDPFIKGRIKPGKRFWVYLYPRTITSLVHKWTHPAFEETTTNEVYASPASKVDSDQWLRNFCENNDCLDYETLISQLQQYIGNGEVRNWTNPNYDDVSIRLDEDYFYVSGRGAHCDIPPEFWAHVENVLGCKVSNHPIYFSCAC